MNRAVKPAVFGTCALAVVGVGIRFLVVNAVRPAITPPAALAPPLQSLPAVRMVSYGDFQQQQLPRDLAAIQDGVKREGVVGLTIDSPDGGSIRFGGTVSPLDRARLLMVAGEVVTTHRYHLFGYRTRLEWGVTVDPTLPQQLPPPANPPELNAVDPARPTGSAYWPLRPGMRWTYVRNAILSRNINDDPTFRRFVGREVTVAGKKCFPVVLEDPVQGEAQTEYHHPTNDGVFFVSAGGELPVFGVPSRFDPDHPRWDIVTPLMQGTAIYMGERQVSVPAGQYTAACVWSHVEWKEGVYYRPPADSIDWYAKGIGLVKRVIITNGQYLDLELKGENVADTLRHADEPGK